MRIRAVAGAILLWAACGAAAWSHEVRPVALGIVEQGIAERGGHQCRVELRCEQALAGRTLSVQWPLYNPSVTTLVRYATREGFTHSAVLTPDVTTWTVPREPSAGDVVRGYFVLGVEHILGGWDHLLFIGALLAVAILIRRSFTGRAADAHRLAARARYLMAYLIGIPAAFWLVQRLPL